MANYVQKGITAPAKVTFGGPRIAVRYVPCEGEEFTVYREKMDLWVGEIVTISPPGWDMPGEVIHDYANDVHFHDQHLCGGKVINGGKGYYKIKVKDIPR
jgi:hypothetical protein